MDKTHLSYLQGEQFAEVFDTALWNGMDNPMDYIDIDSPEWFYVCEALVAEYQNISK